MANGYHDGVSNRATSHQSHSQVKAPPQGLHLSLFPDTKVRPSLLFPSSPAFPPPTVRLPALPSTTKEPLTSPPYATSARPAQSMDQLHNLPRKPSEATRMRTMYQEHHRSPYTFQKAPEAVIENFSRPRVASIKGPRKEIDSKKTLPPCLPTNSEDLAQGMPILGTAFQTRNRGTSGSSIHSPIQIPISARRLETSIPENQAPEKTSGKQQVPSNLTNQFNTILATSESNPTAESKFPVRRDTITLRGGIESEEIRSSFRSAMTANSSSLETNVTERSSVFTQRSSRTSLFVRDEGVSGEDVTGMHDEKGSFDSGGDTVTKSYHESPERKSDSDQPPHFPNGLVTSVTPLQRETENSRPTGKEQISTIKVELEVPIQDAQSISPEIRSATLFDESRDIYGFKKKTQYITIEEYEAWNQPYSAYLARRKKKWFTLMKQHNLSTISPQTFPPKSDKVKRFVRKGIPPSWRGAAWFYYAGGPAIVAKNPGVYHDLVRRALAGGVTETDDEIIERDLNRTFPDNIKFKPDADLSCSEEEAEPAETPILQSLRRVLRAFSIYHPKIGYCQSLNFLAGLLLLFMSEENSFWMLNIITRIFLPGTHSITLEGANVDLGVLMSSVKEMMPSIWAKIGNELDGQPSSPSTSTSMRLPPITLCTTAWFMSCFIGTLPIESTLRVWDSFFYEGSKTLFRIALTIFKLGEPQIKAVTDPMEIFQVVQGIPRGMIDCNRLMESCFKRRGGFVKLTQDDIERGRAERRRGYAEERERIAAGNTAPVSGSTRAKVPVRKGNTLFGRGKKERIRLPVQV